QEDPRNKQGKQRDTNQHADSNYCHIDHNAHLRLLSARLARCAHSPAVSRWDRHRPTWTRRHKTPAPPATARFRTTAIRHPCDTACPRCYPYWRSHIVRVHHANCDARPECLATARHVHSSPSPIAAAPERITIVVHRREHPAKLIVFAVAIRLHFIGHHVSLPQCRDRLLQLVGQRRGVAGVRIETDHATPMLT